MLTLTNVFYKVKNNTDTFGMFMNKEKSKMLYQAISDYGKYTDNQNKVLCFLVEHAVDNLIYPAVKKISEQTGVVKSTVYAAINALQLDGIVEQTVNQKGILKINENKIDFIIRSYKQNKT